MCFIVINCLGICVCVLIGYLLLGWFSVAYRSISHCVYAIYLMMIKRGNKKEYFRPILPDQFTAVGCIILVCCKMQQYKLVNWSRGFVSRTIRRAACVDAAWQPRSWCAKHCQECCYNSPAVPWKND